MAITRNPEGVPLESLLPEHLLAAPMDAEIAATPVSGLTLDSRKVQPGDLFLAVRGASSDGRLYIRQALEAGAVAVMAEADGLAQLPACRDLLERPGVPLVAVADLQRQVSAIAGRFFGNPADRLQLVGFTGTNGKTTCSQLLAQLYSLCGHKTGVIGTLGYGILSCESDLAHTETGMTTPDAVRTQEILAEMLDRGVERVAMEVSSHSLDQFRVAGIRFGTAVFTNLSRDHLDYHGDLASYAAAKASLFSMPGLRYGVINGDDPVGREIAASLPQSVQCLVYSADSARRGGPNGDAAIVARDVRLHREGIGARIDTPWGSGSLQSCLLGEFNLANLLAVIGAACAEGLSLAEVLEHLPGLKPVNGRMQVVSNGNTASVGAPLVVVDYAHTPDALEKSLAALRHHCQGRLWVVFGCGGDRDAGKRPQMGAIAERGADHLVITSDNPRSEQPEAIIEQILAGLEIPQAALVITDRAAAIARAVASAGTGDTVLIAGKGHEQYQQLGQRRLPFSDLAQARLALQHWPGSGPGREGSHGA